MITARRVASTSAIGLDIGCERVKAAQVSLVRSGPRLDYALSIERREPGDHLSDTDAARLVRVMARRGFSGRRVVLVAPAGGVISAAVDVPPADTAGSRDRIVRMELSRAHRLSPDAFECCWWDLPASSTATKTPQAHAVALPHSACRPTLGVLGRHGLDVVRTLPSSVAMLSVAQRRPIDPMRIVAVVDLAARAARLCLLFAGRVVHERTLLDWNGRAIHERLSAQLGVSAQAGKHALGLCGYRDEPDGLVPSETTAVLADPVAELIEEISMSFAYVSHRYPQAELGPLLMVGGGANLPGLSNAMGRMLELEAAVLSPAMMTIGDRVGLESTDAAVTCALGAALAEGGKG